MELKDFVSNTITSIVDGVIDAKELIEKKGAKINPTYSPKAADQFAHRSSDNGEYYKITNVHFDVAVSVNETANTSAGAHLLIASLFKAGASSTDGTENQNISRITFDVNLLLPKE